MKVAVITGAASGIGLALSQVHLEKDAFVVMVDKDEPKLSHEAEQFSTLFPNQVLAIPCDITKAAQVTQLREKIVEHCERLDWLYNNAGIIGNIAPLWELSAAQINRVFEVNLFGMVQVIQEFIPTLFNQNFRSHIINMASMYALCSGSQLAPYSMSKHAVLALSESLYFDFKRMEKPVDLSIVFPSFTDTGLISNSKAEVNHSLHDSLNSLLSHSRPALEVAAHIIQEVERKQFYILPDKEVKGYCEARSQSILLQENPHINNVEKLMLSLARRQKM